MLKVQFNEVVLPRGLRQCEFLRMRLRGAGGEDEAGQSVSPGTLVTAFDLRTLICTVPRCKLGVFLAMAVHLDHPWMITACSKSSRSSDVHLPTRCSMAFKDNPAKDGTDSQQ